MVGQERKAPVKLKEGESCVSKNCHAALVSKVVVHKTKKPCDVCHEQDDETIHKFTYPDKGAELCYGCHKDVTKTKKTKTTKSIKMKFVHEPLKDKKRPCLVCHEPHSTAGKHLIRTKTVTDQCLGCHKKMAEGPRYHKSKAAKGCGGCHVSHAADTGKFLRAKPKDLCYTCHEDIKEDATEAKSVHGPLAVGCISCHEPHRPMTGKGVRKAGASLCMTCHDHFKPKVAAMSKHHPKLLEDKDCARCHKPHFSARKHLLAKTPQKLCLDCHEKDVKAKSGRIVKAMGPELAKGLQLHGPLAKGECGKCHESHGNEQRGFLRKPYPAKFYSPYTAKTYEFCFSCHNPSLAADKMTPIATKFRNGSLNLHFVHVNKSDKGRTCRACHATHATKNTHMLADSVPFGSWRIPIGYTGTKTGGTCASGCHKKQSYDRGKPAAKPPATKPATKPIAKPATKPAPAPAAPKDAGAKPAPTKAPGKPTTRPAAPGAKDAKRPTRAPTTSK